MKPVDEQVSASLRQLRRAHDVGDMERQAMCQRFLSAALRVFRSGRPGGDAYCLEAWPQVSGSGGPRQPQLVITTRATDSNTISACLL